jgi:hypothetical protein
MRVLWREVMIALPALFSVLQKYLMVGEFRFAAKALVERDLRRRRLSSATLDDRQLSHQPLFFFGGLLPLKIGFATLPWSVGGFGLLGFFPSR